jgi:hypothetical protein
MNVEIYFVAFVTKKKETYILECSNGKYSKKKCEKRNKEKM